MRNPGFKSSHPNELPFTLDVSAYELLMMMDLEGMDCEELLASSGEGSEQASKKPKLVRRNKGNG